MLDKDNLHMEDLMHDERFRVLTHPLSFDLYLELVDVLWRRTAWANPLCTEIKKEFWKKSGDFES